MPTFKVCGRLIPFDYPASLAECGERILALAAQAKILERTGQKEAAIIADCELAMLQEWQKSSYFLTMMTVKNCTKVSESKLKEESGLVRHLQSVLLRLQRKGVDIGEEAKVVCQFAREWLASKGCKDIPPEYLIPDKFQAQDSPEAIRESQLVMNMLNGKTSLTQLGQALDSKLNDKKSNSSLKGKEDVTSQIEPFTKDIEDMKKRLYDLETVSIKALTEFKSEVHSLNDAHTQKLDAKFLVAISEFTSLKNRMNDLENIQFQTIESILTPEQIRELVSSSTGTKNRSNKGGDTSNASKLLKKYQDEIKVLSASRKDRVSQLEKKVEYLTGFTEIERNIRMSQHRTTSNNIKFLKEACFFVTQALSDKNKTQQIEMLLSSVAFVSNGNLGNHSTPSKVDSVKELSLFN
jgi:hypothetical protein